MPSFAVVIPTFNRADLLPETLDSLFAQTVPFARVIVVDDGSTDGTAAMLASRTPRCMVIEQSRGRQQRARNRGIAAADTDWIVFCDNDDLLLPEYLEQVAAVVHRVPGLDAVYCNNATFRGTHIERADAFATQPGFWEGLEDIDTAFIGGGVELAARKAAISGLLWPTGLAVRREFFDVIGMFDERMADVPFEDYEFTLRVIASGRVAFLKSPLARIRLHAGNASDAGELEVVKGLVYMLQFCLDHHPHARRPVARGARGTAGASLEPPAVYRVPFRRLADGAATRDRRQRRDAVGEAAAADCGRAAARAGALGRGQAARAAAALERDPYRWNHRSGESRSQTTS
ncbi:MAG: glycosyltransferase family A protein [Acetobacteraceae bacterium]